jgi:hypothetical protein
MAMELGDLGPRCVAAQPMAEAMGNGSERRQRPVAQATALRLLPFMPTAGAGLRLSVPQSQDGQLPNGSYAQSQPLGRTRPDRIGAAEKARTGLGRTHADCFRAPER